MKKLEKSSSKQPKKDQKYLDVSQQSKRMIELTDAQKEELLSQVCSGASMREAALAADVAIATLYRVLHRDADFATSMASARRAQQDSEIEKCVEMADQATPEDWQVVKLRIWARQWRASKLAPKRYGDKLELSGDAENPLMIQKIERVIVSE